MSVLATIPCLDGQVLAQRPLPYLDPGRDSIFTQLDFTEMYLDRQSLDPAERQKAANISSQGTIDSGVVSVRDLAAPEKAIYQFNRAITCLRRQDAKSAIDYLRKAIKTYPQFVSAHNALGIAYLDQREDLARVEFETAAQLDDQFPGSFLNLGVLALRSHDFATANSSLHKAASLRSNDPEILTALAFAENGDHQYAEAIKTARRVHTLNHHGLAKVHYVAAGAAQSLHDYDGMRDQLSTFLAEDPTNPFAPTARNYLNALANRKAHNPAVEQSKSIQSLSSDPEVRVITFPNSPHLRAEWRSIPGETDGNNSCDACSAPPQPDLSSAQPYTSPGAEDPPNLFTIHQAVDETALFFSVSHHGQMVTDLALSDIQIRDNNKPPGAILQFTPQSELPLRLGLLIDVSDSLSHRFAFEKQAAEKFVTSVLTGNSDLAFVGAFNDQISVTQDFTHDTAQLARGIENLHSGGETSVFDAVFFACWKLAAYPDEGRVAKVLVVLTDGEDNSSHRTLQQSLQEAEAAGVTIYTISTSENLDLSTDANNILKVLAQRSGGDAIFPHSLHALDSYLRKLPDVIRSRYLVAYKPADFVPDGKYRRVSLKVEKNGQKEQVHTRPGYYTRQAMPPNEGIVSRNTK